MKILVTGAAGFIGFHLCKRLFDCDLEIVGLDNMNDYYDISLKEDRLAELKSNNNDFVFYKTDLADKNAIDNIFKKHQFDIIINLAAQAGVRYSITNPDSYIHSNLIGFMNILEACRHNNIKHLIYASSSSVYGSNKKVPFSVKDNVDHPVSLYAATKKSNELLAHSYSHLYNIPVTGLRFFTVYGPWGRPDMAYFKFTKKMLNGEKIEIYNNGDMMRDFTYIDDIVESIYRLIDKPPLQDENWDAENSDPGTSSAPYRVYNIGNNKPENLLKFVEVLEKKLGVKAVKEFLPMQPGDVKATYADIDDLIKTIDYQPVIDIEAGLESFIEWYKDYYKN